MALKWRIAGEEVVSCNCAWAVPVNLMRSQRLGVCEAIAAWQIRDGYYGDIRLDGVRFVRVYSWPGALHLGNGTRLNIIDEEASAEQRTAVLALETGTQGGRYFEIFAAIALTFSNRFLLQ